MNQSQAEHSRLMLVGGYRVTWDSLYLPVYELLLNVIKRVIAHEPNKELSDVISRELDTGL
jgi:hypothetical protein